MNIRKIGAKAVRIMKNAASPREIGIPCQQAADYLERIHHDPQSSCVIPDGQAMKKDEFDLSVVIPTYNRSKLVCRMVDSVLKQATAYSFEVLIVDDGSTDNTPEVLKKYENLKNVTVIHQENQGPSVSRNTAISCAKGKYLMFGDDDDEYLPGCIEQLMKAAYSYDADIAEGQVVKVRNGCEIRQPSVDREQVISDLSLLIGYSCAKVIRKTLFKKIRFQPGYWYEDFMNPKILFRLASKCVLIPDFVYRYELHQDSITGSSAGNVKALDSLYVTRQLLKDCKTLELPETMETYTSFIKTVHTVNRLTVLLDDKVRQAVFGVLCSLQETYYAGFLLEQGHPMKKLEQAMKKHNYRSYLLACEFIIQ